LEERDRECFVGSCRDFHCVGMLSSVAVIVVFMALEDIFVGLDDF
jgi:hypothetical protein